MPLLPSYAGLRGHAARLWREAAESEPVTEARAAYEGWQKRRDRQALRLDPEMARALLQVIEEEPIAPGLAPLRTTVFDQQKCKHCLSLHSRNCPAVKEIEFHPDGRVARVLYFDRWDESSVLWREDIEAAAAWKDPG